MIKLKMVVIVGLIFTLFSGCGRQPEELAEKIIEDLPITLSDEFLLTHRTILGAELVGKETFSETELQIIYNVISSFEFTGSNPPYHGLEGQERTGRSTGSPLELHVKGKTHTVIIYFSENSIFGTLASAVIDEDPHSWSAARLWFSVDQNAYEELKRLIYPYPIR